MALLLKVRGQPKLISAAAASIFPLSLSDFWSKNLFAVGKNASHRQLYTPAETAKLLENIERGDLRRLSRSYFAQLHKMRHEIDLTPANLAGYDCVVIATDHSSYEYPAVLESAPLVVDARNTTRSCCTTLDKPLK